MKKAFTLIELLAVIIILAIIALIATPIVLDVINDARKSASKSAAALVLDSAKLYYAEQYIKPNGNFEGYECTISNKSGCNELSLEGDKPDSAIITINSEGRISGKVVFGNYTYYYCNNTLSETEDAACPLNDYELIYEINSEGIITGFKKVSATAYNFIPKVYADELTTQAINYINGKEITIPEYIGEIEVKGIAANAFNSYDIDVITILPIIELQIGTNAFPTDLVTLKVKECVEDYYYDYRNILELIESTCVIERYKDTVLNGADPELDEGMIPVVINSDGSLTKASMIKQWYNYTDKQWANVVLVSEESREGYLNAKAGSPINTTDVLAYFVWVPRYKYQIFTDVNNLQTLGSISDSSKYTNKANIINVVFENNETTKSTGSTKDSWLTHPAFTFGNEELNGIWIGKFETTGTANAPTVLAYDSRYTETSGIQSLRSQNVSAQFATSQKINYGLTDKEASMLKNMEWGAVAYLTGSQYGQGTTEVMINNSSNYNTGCAASEYPTTTYGGYSGFAGCENEWYTSAGQKASTTGNMYGIYDMSGGAWEYVMGVMEDTQGNPASGRNNDYNSGFTGTLTYPNDGSDSSITSITGVSFPDSKYYDVYPYNTSSVVYAERGQLGDATFELDGFTNWKDPDGNTRYHSGWNQDYASFVYNGIPWFIRGGAWYDGASAGVFAFGYNYGDANSGVSFRSVLR